MNVTDSIKSSGIENQKPACRSLEWFAPAYFPMQKVQTRVPTSFEGVVSGEVQVRMMSEGGVCINPSREKPNYRNDVWHLHGKPIRV